MDEEQKQAEINACRNLLEQNDYIGRKVAFEVAAKLKELHPDLSTPVYEKYLATEEQANGFRANIEMLKNTSEN